ncbi:class I SAM-dependent methyltransferase [Sinorhizobium prairiense]|uniref:class I SAM-dependent methyltransferase n=1 Tax=unclassified Sinorhizobium TaxID=2613772 RepID=UPI0023D839B4|nr:MULTISPECIES: class I SAM-dependent methyltransferase [unclassified Sinorhizobium]WEJ09193.1 class I SAM-dependent methyltransferase [Sinorhizobium sp. M103]WEJ16262.1 class I SAM-dependent methyltransferase [Sinorhizobium sp. K101]WEJ36155.1 class I SAM-dependent methyltransferase [Sinorhizobium sp. C101]
MSAVQTANESQAHLMDRMYRYQRYIYDFTRKYYLFGRDTLIRELNPPPGASVLEVGCGTGRNLAMLGELYPGARLFGLDISAEMLATAKAKLRRQNRADAVLRVADATNFTAASFDQEGFDRIVISYALSMVPEWEKAVDAAIAALKPGGSLHIVDFGQQEGWPAGFRRLLQAWLGRFHVTPRESLFDAMRKRAERDGAALEVRSLGRGYAWLAVYRRAAP